MKILNILNEIASISGDNDKKKKLKSFIDLDVALELQTVLYLAYSPRIKYYIKNIPPASDSSSPFYTCWDEIKQDLQVLSKREKTGHAAIEHLSIMLGRLDEDDATVIKRIIGKDLKFGMGASSINKVCPGLIEETPYMGAVSYKKDKVVKLFNKHGKLAIQTKMDGRYCNAVLSEGNIYLESRSGEETNLYTSLFAHQLIQVADKFPCVLTGELTIPGIDRYKSNGIITSLVAIRKKIANDENVDKEVSEFELEHQCSIQQMQDRILFTFWDSVSLEGFSQGFDSTPYTERLSKARTIANAIADTNFESRCNLIDSKLVSTFNDALLIFQKLLEKGEEGAILKAIKEGWKDGKPSYQIKLKLDVAFDLKVTGFQKGTPGTKNEGKYSVILLESSDGLLKTRAGGLKEAEVDYITANADILLNQIAEVRSCGITKIEGAEYRALLHPSFVKFRDDKTQADSLQQCLDIEAMSLGLKL